MTSSLDVAGEGLVNGQGLLDIYFYIKKKTPPVSALVVLFFSCNQIW